MESIKTVVVPIRLPVGEQLRQVKAELEPWLRDLEGELRPETRYSFRLMSHSIRAGKRHLTYEWARND
jgi:hypothetical protein